MSDIAMNKETSAVFLNSVSEIWIAITTWTMMGTAAVFFIAGSIACRVGNDNFIKMIYFPLLAMAFGAFVGFIQGGLSAVLIALIYTSIPYSVGIDIAAGLGMGQAVVIVYFHLGRADFIHR